jgi:pantoate--beta-alanine ligase
VLRLAPRAFSDQKSGMEQPLIFHTPDAMRTQLAAWRAHGQRIGFVPTMGALHEGHISLTHIAREQAERVIVSIFVNPTQFAPHEDFNAYPRSFESDLAQLRDAGVDGVYYPSADIIYPAGFATTISLAGPALADLEDRFRPTHFQGVATIVAKLLIQSAADVAVFGQKDFQQLAVISHMVRDLDLPVRIIGAPIIREEDGLAKSSRNAYLSPTERTLAPALYQSLQKCCAHIKKGANAQIICADEVQRLTDLGFKVDYLEVRDATTLAPADRSADGLAQSSKRRLLIAARIGSTRLIDNIAIDE